MADLNSNEGKAAWYRKRGMTRMADFYDKEAKKTFAFRKNSHPVGLRSDVLENHLHEISINEPQK